MDLINRDANSNRSILNNLGGDTNASEIDLIIQHGLSEISTQVSSFFTEPCFVSVYVEREMTIFFTGDYGSSNSIITINTYQTKSKGAKQ